MRSCLKYTLTILLVAIMLSACGNNYSDLRERYEDLQSSYERLQRNYLRLQNELDAFFEIAYTAAQDPYGLNGRWEEQRSDNISVILEFRENNITQMTYRRLWTANQITFDDLEIGGFNLLRPTMAYDTSF